MTLFASGWLAGAGCTLRAPEHEQGSAGHATDSGGSASTTSGATNHAGTSENGGSTTGSSGGDDTQPSGGTRTTPATGSAGDDAEGGLDGVGGVGGRGSGGRGSAGGRGGGRSGGTPAIADLTCTPRPPETCSTPLVGRWSNWPVTDNDHRYTATDDQVTDNATSLIWQRNVATLPMSECTGPARFTRAEANCYCNAFTLPGATSGWRVPSRSELTSIMEYGLASAVNLTIFPQTPLTTFWTLSGRGNSAWTVDAANGAVTISDDFTGGHLLRCVRGGAPAPSVHYTAGTDALAGTVLDNATKLRWHQVAIGPSSPEGLAQLCADSTLGQLAWRLPRISELLSLIDETKTNPACDTAFFSGGVYAFASSTADITPEYVQGVNFSLGQTESIPTNSTSIFGRCVTN